MLAPYNFYQTVNTGGEDAMVNWYLGLTWIKTSPYHTLQKLKVEFRDQFRDFMNNKFNPYWAARRRDINRKLQTVDDGLFDGGKEELTEMIEYTEYLLHANFVAANQYFDGRLMDAFNISFQTRLVQPDEKTKARMQATYQAMVDLEMKRLF